MLMLVTLMSVSVMAIDTTGLIAYYKLEESSSTYTDSHGGNDATSSDIPAQQVGKSNFGQYFDRTTGEYIATPTEIKYLSNVDNVTITTWAKHNNSADSILWAGQRNSAFNQGYVYLEYTTSSDSYTVHIEGDNAGEVTCNVAGGQDWNNNTMHFYAFIHNGADRSNSALWIDNVEYTCDLSGYTGVEVVGGSDKDLWIMGSYQDDGAFGLGWDGVIDEFAIWNNSLTSVEISELYNAGDGFFYPFSTIPKSEFDISETTSVGFYDFELSNEGWVFSNNATRTQDTAANGAWSFYMQFEEPMTDSIEKVIPLGDELNISQYINGTCDSVCVGREVLIDGNTELSSVKALSTNGSWINESIDTSFYNDGLNHTVKINSAACFVPNTQVLTTNGEKSIESLEVGEEIITWNEQTELQEIGQVVRTMEHKGVWDTYLINKNVEATYEHPFYTTHGQVFANTLRIGDVIIKSNGKYELVFDIEKKEYTGVVHDLTVSGNHNYYANGVLVHNKVPTSKGYVDYISNFDLDNSSNIYGKIEEQNTLIGNNFMNEDENITINYKSIFNITNFDSTAAHIGIANFPFNVSINGSATTIISNLSISRTLNSTNVSLNKTDGVLLNITFNSDTDTYNNSVIELNVSNYSSGVYLENVLIDASEGDWEICDINGATVSYSVATDVKITENHLASGINNVTFCIASSGGLGIASTEDYFLTLDLFKVEFTEGLTTKISNSSNVVFETSSLLASGSENITTFYEISNAVQFISEESSTSVLFIKDLNFTNLTSNTIDAGVITAFTNFSETADKDTVTFYRFNTTLSVYQEDTRNINYYDFDSDGNIDRFSFGISENLGQENYRITADIPAVDEGSGGSGAGAGGGGAGTTTIITGSSKSTCSISVSPEIIRLSAQTSLVEVEITNNEDFTFDPSIGFGEVEGKTSALSDLALTNTIESLLPTGTESIGIQYSGEGLENAENTLVLSSDRCEEIEVTILINQGILETTVLNLFDADLTFLENLKAQMTGNVVDDLELYGFSFNWLKGWMLFILLGGITLIPIVPTIRRLNEKDKRAQVLIVLAFTILISYFIMLMTIVLLRLTFGG